MSELELCDLGEQYFTRRGWKVYREVPLGGGCVDMFLTRRDRQTVVGIEFKLHDWKKAFVQARKIRTVTPFAFVAMPKRRKIYQPMVEMAGIYQVGLMFFNDEGLTIAVRPTRKDFKDWPLWWIDRFYSALEFVQSLEYDRLPNERWSDWAKRHNAYTKKNATCVQQ